MKIITKFLVAAFFLFVVTNLQAQRGNWGADPEERAKQQTAMMADSLSLSEAQTTKVGEINLKYAKEFSEMRNSNSDGDWSAMREKMGALRQKQNEELKAVLTTGQYDKWSKIQEAQRGRRGGPGSRGGQPREKNG